MLSLILPFRQGRYLFIQTECVSSHWDALRFAKAYEKNTVPNFGNNCFWEICPFPKLGKFVFAIFMRSQSWEQLFLGISPVPKVGKACFRCFHAFPKLGAHIGRWLKVANSDFLGGQAVADQRLEILFLLFILIFRLSFYLLNCLKCCNFAAINK